jgi:hypothetical protein
MRQEIEVVTWHRTAVTYGENLVRGLETVLRKLNTSEFGSLGRNYIDGMARLDHAEGSAGIFRNDVSNERAHDTNAGTRGDLYGDLAMFVVRSI